MSINFKIGDIVKGNEKSDGKYIITNSYCVGEVIETNEFGIILLKIISHERYEDQVGEEYPVDDYCFDLVMPNNWTGLYGVANYRKLFTIENGVPVVNNVGKDSPCYKQLCDEYAKYMENMKKETEAGDTVSSKLVCILPANQIIVML